MTDPSTSESALSPGAFPSSTTNVSGGVNVDAGQVDIGGDDLTRDNLTDYQLTLEVCAR